MISWRQRFSEPYETLNRIEVSKERLLHNYDLVVSQHPNMAIMPVLKGNAYGHGLLQVAEILQKRQPPYIVVDGYFEALKLRRLTRRPILIMGYINPSNYAVLKTEGLAFVVHDQPTLEALAKLRRSITVHLEINTGMNRQGIQPAELVSYLALFKSHPSLKLEGIMSHLADADGETTSYTREQVELFDQCVQAVLAAGFKPKLIHLAQTAGSVRAVSAYANAMRLGIGLYGINPFGTGTPSHQRLAGLSPALTFKSTIIKVIEVKKGEKISYNGIFTAKTATRIGVLPLGYYEGVPRSLSNNGVVKHGQEYFPIAGRVCMNHIMIDLGTSKAGYMDQVEVISNKPADQNSVARLESEQGLFSYELLTGLSESVRRVVV